MMRRSLTIFRHLFFFLALSSGGEQILALSFIAAAMAAIVAYAYILRRVENLKYSWLLEDTWANKCRVAERKERSDENIDVNDEDVVATAITATTMLNEIVIRCRWNFEYRIFILLLRPRGLLLLVFSIQTLCFALSLSLSLEIRHRKTWNEPFHWIKMLQQKQTNKKLPNKMADCCLSQYFAKNFRESSSHAYGGGKEKRKRKREKE